MPDLYLCIRPRDGEHYVAVVGRLDRSTCDALTHHVSDVLARPEATQATGLVIDLRCCTTLDPAGARALYAVREATEQTGRTFRLTGVPPLMEQALADFPRSHLK